MAHAHPRGELWYPMPFQLLCQAVPPALSSCRSRTALASRPSLSLCKGPPPSLISGVSYSLPLEEELVPDALQCGLLLLPPAPPLPSSRRPQLLHPQKGVSTPSSPAASLSTVLGSLRPQTFFRKRPLPASPKPARYRVLGCPRPQSCSLKGAPLPCTPSPSHFPQTQSHTPNGESALGSPTTSLCSLFSSRQLQGPPLKGRPLASRAGPARCRTVPCSPLIQSYPLLKGPLPSRASPSLCSLLCTSLRPRSQPLKGKPISSPKPSRGKAIASLRPRSHPPKGLPVPSSPKPPQALVLKETSVSPRCKLPCSTPGQSALLLGAPLSSVPSLSCRGLFHSLRLSPLRQRELAFPVDMVLASPELLFPPYAQDLRERELGIAFFALPGLSQGIPPNSPTSGFSPTPTPCSLYPGLGSPGSQDGHTPTLCPKMIQSVPLSGVSREPGESYASWVGDAGREWDLDTDALQPRFGGLATGRHLSG